MKKTLRLLIVLLLATAILLACTGPTSSANLSNNTQAENHGTKVVGKSQTLQKSTPCQTFTFTGARTFRANPDRDSNGMIIGCWTFPSTVEKKLPGW